MHYQCHLSDVPLLVAQGLPVADELHERRPGLVHGDAEVVQGPRAVVLRRRTTTGGSTEHRRYCDCDDEQGCRRVAHAGALHCFLAETLAARLVLALRDDADEDHLRADLGVLQVPRLRLACCRRLGPGRAARAATCVARPAPLPLSGARKLHACSPYFFSQTEGRNTHLQVSWLRAPMLTGRDGQDRGSGWILTHRRVAREGLRSLRDLGSRSQSPLPCVRPHPSLAT